MAKKGLSLALSSVYHSTSISFCHFFSFCFGQVCGQDYILHTHCKIFAIQVGLARATANTVSLYRGGQPCFIVVLVVFLFAHVQTHMDDRGCCSFSLPFQHAWTQHVQTHAHTRTHTQTIPVLSLPLI